MSSRPPNEDLFEHSRMSFGEHLEELRKVLIRAVIGVAIACIVGFIFASQVVQFLERPLKKATENFRITQARKNLTAENGFVAPEMEYWFNTARLIPNRVYVDRDKLMEILGISPEVPGINLNPYGFQPAHFDPIRLPRLAKQWLDDRSLDSEDGKQLARLWGLLDPNDQKTIETIAGKSIADANDVTQLILICDKLSDHDLYNFDEFLPVVSKPESSFWSWFNPPAPNPLVDIKLALEKTDDPTLKQRLNRVLITRLFVDQLPQMRLDLVSIDFWESAEIKPQSLTATEPFMIWIKAGVISGLVLASPWVLLQFWLFVATGLYPHEKKYIYVFLPISLLLFLAGASLAFFFVFEPVLSFLFTFNAQMGISPQIRINEWLSFVMFLPLGFGVAFQLPLVMLFMNRINVFSVQTYLSKWRIAVMVIFVLSMILTPSDPISMILLAFPLTILYFLGIGLCQWFPGQQNPFGDVEELAET